MKHFIAWIDADPERVVALGAVLAAIVLLLIPFMEK
jgi:hypothetical protein